MKKLVLWMLILMVAAVLVTGCGKKEEKSAGAAAEGYTGYASLDPDPAETIAFDGRTVKWAGQTFTLGENTYFLDYRLDAAQIAGNPYAFRDIGDALRALEDGTAEKPMTLLIAPGVYWVENFGAQGGTDSLWCTERAIHVDCDNLSLYGLSHEPENVVLGIEHQRAEDDYCSNACFGMFVVDGVGLRCENLTIGSYGTLALDYALAPELSREKQVTDANLQQMLFSPNADGVAVNCCFEGHISLYWFAEYYKDCRMQKGCKVENGACVGCEIELEKRRFTSADLFGCELLFDPIAEESIYSGAEGRYDMRSRYTGEIVAWARNGVSILFETWGMVPDLEHWFRNGAWSVGDGMIRGMNEVSCKELFGSCAEMGLTAEIVGEAYAHPMQMAEYEEKITALQRQIDAAKSPAVKKRLQKMLDQTLNECPPMYCDVWVEPEYKMGYTWALLTLEQIEHIQAWEVQNEGSRILLPLVDNSMRCENWYRVDENGEPLLDENGNLVDAYRRNENGEVMWYDPLMDVQVLRVGKYNYFQYLYGVVPETMFARMPGMMQCWVDVDLVLGEDLKAIPIDFDVEIAGGWVNMMFWDGDERYIHSLNVTVDGEAHKLTNDRGEVCPSVSAELAAALRVKIGEETVYNFPNLYGEDPFCVTESVKQAAAADGKSADAYLSMPLGVRADSDVRTIQSGADTAEITYCLVNYAGNVGTWELYVKDPEMANCVVITDHGNGTATVAGTNDFGEAVDVVIVVRHSSGHQWEVKLTVEPFVAE